MRKILVFVHLLMFKINALAFDPFVNPIRLKDITISHQKLRKQKKLPVIKQEKNKELHLFIPVIHKPFSELSIQGVISSSNGYRLVLLDPSTGETFLLKPGDPISKNEKLIKVTPKEIIIAKFEQKGIKIIRTYERIKLDLGEE